LCGKNFTTKYSLKRHSSRKTPCVAIKNISSVECSEIFSDKLNVLDLFCGCGGTSRGLVDAGLNVTAGIDIWETAVKSYNSNFEHTAYCEDLTKFSPFLFDEKYNKNRRIDVIMCSAPCQSFSISGKREIGDCRDDLFMEFVKYLDYFTPKAFMIENVIGILSKKTNDGKNVIDIMMELLTQNYKCNVSKLYASDFEVPQNRRRVIIIGVRKDLGITPVEPEKIIKNVCDRIPVKSILLNREEVDKSHFLSQRAIDGIIAKKQRSKENGVGFGAQFLDPEKPSYTIPARIWRDGYDALVKYSDTEIRRLTILELKRIQSFSDDYVIVGSKKDVITQIGNAVACRFAYHLGKHITKMLQ